MPCRRRDGAKEKAKKGGRVEWKEGRKMSFFLCLLIFHAWQHHGESQRFFAFSAFLRCCVCFLLVHFAEILLSLCKMNLKKSYTTIFLSFKGHLWVCATKFQKVLKKKVKLPFYIWQNLSVKITAKGRFSVFIKKMHGSIVCFWLFTHMTTVYCGGLKTLNFETRFHSLIFWIRPSDVVV